MARYEGMAIHAASSSPPRRLSASCAIVRSLTRVCLGLVTASWALAAEPAKRTFDLPAGPGDKSLKLFSEQAGLEVLFPTKVARSVRTREVKGEMTPKEVLDLMLAGSGLVVIQDPKTQAFSIRRETDSEKKGQRAAQTTGSDRPTR